MRSPAVQAGRLQDGSFAVDLCGEDPPARDPAAPPRAHALARASGAPTSRAPSSRRPSRTRASLALLPSRPPACVASSSSSSSSSSSHMMNSSPLMIDSVTRRTMSLPTSYLHKFSLHADLLIDKSSYPFPVPGRGWARGGLVVRGIIVPCKAGTGPIGPNPTRVGGGVGGGVYGTLLAETVPAPVP